MYSKKVMEIFKKPHNMGRISNADGIGKVGNVVCGDIMYIYIKVEDKLIKEVKFETFGCVSAIATSSMITDMAKGKTLEQAMMIGRNNVADELGGLPPIKMHCSNLAADALHEAIYDYMSKKKMKMPVKLKKEHERIQKELNTVEHRH